MSVPQYQPFLNNNFLPEAEIGHHYLPQHTIDPFLSYSQGPSLPSNAMHTNWYDPIGFDADGFGTQPFARDMVEMTNNADINPGSTAGQQQSDQYRKIAPGPAKPAYEPPRTWEVPGGTMHEATGPMSKPVSMPPLNKPGRKAMPPDESADRRKVQNRVAQRNHRDKRQQKLAETVQELADRKTEYENGTMELARQHTAYFNQLQTQMQNQHAQVQGQIEQMQTTIQQLQTTIQVMQERNETLITYVQMLERDRQTPRRGDGAAVSASVVESVENAFSPSGRQPRKLGPIGYTPPSDPPRSAMPVDFTSTFSRPQPAQATGTRPSLSNETSHSMTSLDSGAPSERCGFCTEADVCECAQQRLMNDGQPAYTAGNCDHCRADPQRAQRCRNLAQHAQARPAEATPRRPWTCSTFMNRAESVGARFESVTRGIVQGQAQLSTSNVAGFEIDENEAARVLQDIAASQGPQ